MMCPQLGIKQASFGRTTWDGASAAVACPHPEEPRQRRLEGCPQTSWFETREDALLTMRYWPHSLNRIPIENIRRAVELVKRRLQRRHGVLGDGLRRPAFAAVHRAQWARLAHQEDLVHAHRKDLPGDVLGGVAEQKGADRRDFFRAHLLDLCDARLFLLGLGRNGADQAAP